MTLHAHRMHDDFVNLHAESIGKRVSLRNVRVLPAVLKLCDALPSDRPAVLPNLLGQFSERKTLLLSQFLDPSTIDHVVPPSSDHQNNDAHLICQEGIYIGCEDGHHCAMDGMPETCGAALDALKKHFGIEEIRDLARAAGISRPTLDGWKQRPDAKLNVNGRDHLRRILLGQERPAAEQPRTVTNADLSAKLDRVIALLDGLLVLRQQGRLEDVVAVNGQHAVKRAKKA